MALINTFGAESGDESELLAAGGTRSVQTAIKRALGSYAFRVNPATTSSGYGTMGGINADGSLGDYSITKGIYSFYLYISSLPSSSEEDIFTILENTTTFHMNRLKLKSNGDISIFRDFSNLYGTIAAGLTTGQWYRIDYIYDSSAATHTYDFRVNGVSKGSGSYTGYGTNQGRCVLGKFLDSNGVGYDVTFDDCIISNTNVYPTYSLLAAIPSVAGTTSNFTGTVADIDEIPSNGDTDYLVKSSSTNQKTTVNIKDYNTTNFLNSTSEDLIVAVKGHIIVRKENSGDTVSTRCIVRRVNELTTSGRNIGTTYESLFKMQEVDPNDGTSFFTQTTYNAVEIGVSEANAGIVRCSTIYGHIMAVTPVITTQAGNISSASTFVQARVPGEMDIVVNSHALTINSNITLGHSPNVSDRFQALLTKAAVTISPSVELTALASVHVGNAAFNMGAGSVLSFDSSKAQTKSTAKYKFQLGTDHNQTSCRLNVTANSANPAIIRTVGTGAKAYIDSGGFLQGGLSTGTDLTINNMGDSSTDVWQIGCSSGTTFDVINYLFNSCGRMSGTFNMANNVTFKLTGCIFNDTQQSDTFQFQTNGYASGTRLIDGCYFDKNVNMFAFDGFVIRDTVFGGYYIATEPNSAAVPTLLRCVIRQPVDDHNVFFNWDSVVLIMDDPTASNLHGGDFLGGSYTQTIDNSWIYNNTTQLQHEADCILFDNPASPQSLAVRRTVFLPNPLGRDSGCALNFVSGANVSASIEHCTIFVGGSSFISQGAIVTGETYAARAGIVTSFKSNLVVDKTTSGFGYVFTHRGGSALDNPALPANVNYNAYFQLPSGASKYQNVTFSGGTVDANSIVLTANPFKNWNANPETFSTFLGGNGTIADLMSRFRAKTTTPTALINYLKDAYSVNAVALNNAGHDGVTIGAGTYYAVSTGTIGAKRRRGLGQ